MDDVRIQKKQTILLVCVQNGYGRNRYEDCEQFLIATYSMRVFLVMSAVLAERVLASDILQVAGNADAS